MEPRLRSRGSAKRFSKLGTEVTFNGAAAAKPRKPGGLSATVLRDLDPSMEPRLRSRGSPLRWHEY